VEQGVTKQLTAVYSPQQNGVVEKRNGTVVGTTRSMLKAKNMPNCLWDEAVLAVVYVLNRMSTRSVEGATTFEVWYGKKPTVHHLHTFGCLAYVKNTKPNLSKLDDRGRRIIFIGYEQGTKAYRVYV
jgi:transposase InsO family protein